MFSKFTLTNWSQNRKNNQSNLQKPLKSKHKPPRAPPSKPSTPPPKKQSPPFQQCLPQSAQPLPHQHRPMCPRKCQELPQRPKESTFPRRKKGLKNNALYSDLNGHFACLIMSILSISIFTLSEMILILYKGFNFVKFYEIRK